MGEDVVAGWAVQVHVVVVEDMREGVAGPQDEAEVEHVEEVGVVGEGPPSVGVENIQ